MTIYRDSSGKFRRKPDGCIGCCGGGTGCPCAYYSQVSVDFIMTKENGAGNDFGSFTQSYTLTDTDCGCYTVDRPSLIWLGDCGASADTADHCNFPGLYAGDQLGGAWYWMCDFAYSIIRPNDSGLPCEITCNYSWYITNINNSCSPNWGGGTAGTFDFPHAMPKDQDNCCDPTQAIPSHTHDRLGFTPVRQNGGTYLSLSTDVKVTFIP